MLSIQHLTYLHPDKSLLFKDLHFSLTKHQKVALIGNNGTGKSTLLKIIADELHATEGFIKSDEIPFYIPQVFGQYNNYSIAQALKIDAKLNALQQILAGNMSEQQLDVLQEDWNIEERCKQALDDWQLQGLDLNQKMETLSGGQKTKVFLAGINIHQAKFVLLDEPSNHLDADGRELLYNFIKATSCTLLVVSHDKKLLNLLSGIYELYNNGITAYGGNYDFYVAQKELENNALQQDLLSKEKTLRKAKAKERESIERQQRLDARGKKKQEKAGVAKIMMNTLRNKAEQSTSKIKDVHADKIEGIKEELETLRTSLPDLSTMKLAFDNSGLHKGKVLYKALDINFSYQRQFLWSEHLNFEILSGERVALKGTNGSGKTSLVKILLGNLKPSIGQLQQNVGRYIYIDQEYSIINNTLTVYQQAQQFNTNALQEHEVRIMLSRFLFGKEDWDKICNVLSGGEKMRLLLCCIVLNRQSPDLIVLDEPTNNLDIQNVGILTNAINAYQGTLIVISHDEYFLEEIGIMRTIGL